MLSKDSESRGLGAPVADPMSSDVDWWCGILGVGGIKLEN